MNKNWGRYKSTASKKLCPLARLSDSKQNVDREVKLVSVHTDCRQYLHASNAKRILQHDHKHIEGVFKNMKL
jgi:hypothetical protein